MSSKVSATKVFRVDEGSSVRLGDHDPSRKDGELDKESAAARIEENAAKLGALQYALYAEGRRSLLLVLQGLDASGKDGTIRHVLGAMNPQGARVHSFKAPSQEEAAHHFLWRADVHAPAKGEVVVFNRSHYEDVLVVRVHELVPKDVWSKRYELINDFERNLAESGTRIVKIFLHISPDEQLRRFEKRLDDPGRRWKISEADYAERALWPAYVEAYEEMLSRTSRPHAPWYIVPSNHKWFRNLTVSRILVDALESLEIQLPAPTVDIEEIRRKFHTAQAKAAELDAAVEEVDD